MSLSEAVVSVERALASPMNTWPGYTPAEFPYILYDEEGFTLLNHPNPPTTWPDDLQPGVMPINAVLTAVVPLPRQQNDLLPHLYRTGFKLYQQMHFAQLAQLDMYRALAYYPGFDAAYRALCVTEAEVLTQAKYPPEQKATYLAALTKQRYGLLHHHEDVLNLIRHLERTEDTARYVEQKARNLLRSSNRYTLTPDVKWTRQTGTALCWLLDALEPGWQAQVETGKTPADVLVTRYGDEPVDLSPLTLRNTEIQQERAIEREQGRALKKIRLIEGDALHIQLPREVTVRRDMQLERVIALGDGRLLHEQFLTLTFEGGFIECRGCPVVEDYTGDDVLVSFHALPFRVENGTMKASTLTVKFSIPDAIQIADNVFRLGSA
ncbi:MAG: hypothetical protein OHK0046_15760 [Anaerolineae bacterium]